MWKTANGDNILQLVGSSKMHIAHMPSAVISNSRSASCIIRYFKPDLRTADGDTILQLVYQSEILVSQMSSALMLKWLSDSTDLNDMKIDTLRGTTADGNNFLELICQSEKCLIQISSTVFLNWLRNSVLHSMTIAIPDGKTADGDTLLQLILRSISRISSQMLTKLLSNSRKISIDEIKNINPNWKTVNGVHFPHVLCLSNIENDKVIELMQYYILENGWNPDTSDSDENTVLHIACLTDKLALVLYLIDQTECNPIVENSEGSLPIDMTTNLKIINCVYQHNRVSLRSQTIIKRLNNPKVDHTTMLCILKSLVDNHKTITEDGSTLLHVICMCSMSRDKQRLIDYLLTECQCDPNCLDSKGRMPIQLTSDLGIMKTFIDNGAQMTTDVVFELISLHNIDYRLCELLKLSTMKGTLLWNPNDLNSDGYTALHLACKADSFVIVTYLLSVAHCDPNIKGGIEGYTALHLACKAEKTIIVKHLLTEGHCDPNIKSNSNKVPLQLTTNSEIIKDLIRHGAKTSIMYKSYYKKALGTNKPLQPPVKVFVVGNPLVGKSTLTAALKTEIGIFARYFSSRKVSGVDEKTVGIVPHDLEGGHFGRVTLYDFAGHREFYSGHAALLQTAIESTPPIFLLVVNISEDDYKIIKNILYWISFLHGKSMCFCHV